MSTLKVANLHFEATGNNRIELVNNAISISTGGTERLNISNSGITTPAVLGGALPQIADYVRGLAGSVVQVVSATTSTEVNISGTTWTDTSLTATITPSSASNKILVLALSSVFTGRFDSGGVDKVAGGTRIVRGTTPLLSTEGYVSQMSAQPSVSTNMEIATRLANFCLDSPNTTAPTIYKIQARGASALDVVYTQSFGDETSVIILMEIAA